MYMCDQTLTSWSLWLVMSVSTSLTTNIGFFSKPEGTESPKQHLCPNKKHLKSQINLTRKKNHVWLSSENKAETAEQTDHNVDKIPVMSRPNRDIKGHNEEPWALAPVSYRERKLSPSNALWENRGGGNLTGTSSSVSVRGEGVDRVRRRLETFCSPGITTKPTRAVQRQERCNNSTQLCKWGKTCTVASLHSCEASLASPGCAVLQYLYF